MFCSLYGHLDPIIMDFVFGRIQSRVGFAWIRVDSGTPESDSANPALNSMNESLDVVDEYPPSRRGRCR